MTRWISAAAVALAGVLPLPALAAGIVLTVEAPSGDQTFDMQELREMPAVTIQTETIWTDGQQTFTGVPLAALTERLGIEEGVIEAMAINAYAVQIPVSDAVDGGPLIAYERNGAEMPVRDKGPLWIVYPYDSKPEYRSEEIYSRSIWQLEKLSVKP